MRPDGCRGSRRRHTYTAQRRGAEKPHGPADVDGAARYGRGIVWQTYPAALFYLFILNICIYKIYFILSLFIHPAVAEASLGSLLVFEWLKR